MERALRDRGKRWVEPEFGINVKTINKWVWRFEAEGRAGLRDRSSQRQRCLMVTVRELELAVLALRRQRLALMSIAQQLGFSCVTVVWICARAGLKRLAQLDLPSPVRRAEGTEAGDLLHMDVKKLGEVARIGHRISGDTRDRVDEEGWECGPSAMDDASRVGDAQVLPDENGDSATAYMREAVANYAVMRAVVHEVLTDNGACCRSRPFVVACRDLGLVLRITWPYTARTSGEADRVIQTAFRGWAHARASHHSGQRIAELPRWLRRYDWHQSHAGLVSHPPVFKLVLTRNNRARLHMHDIVQPAAAPGGCKLSIGSSELTHQSLESAIRA